MTSIGVLGGSWRATVSPWGAIEPWDGSPALDWYVAADDRWHVPAEEPSVRQTLRTGAPVVETRLRVPKGDVVHRTWCVADHGGLTVVEIENDSPLPVAVALSRRDLLTARPPTATPAPGIDLPPDAIVLPLAHRATLTVALAHRDPRPGVLPDGWSSSTAVERGWHAVAERASRLVLPDDALTDALTEVRCELALAGPRTDDDVELLLGIGELVRLGERAEPWALTAVEAAERLGRRRVPGWDVAAALEATARVLLAAGEGRRAVEDASAMAQRLRADDRPSSTPTGVRLVPWVEGELAAPVGGRDDAALLPFGHRPAWLGAPLEVYRVPVGPDRHVSFALRWHGERPAVLWEVSGPPGLRLTGGAADPAWSTTEPSGEALWSPPPVAPPAPSLSFS